MNRYPGRKGLVAESNTVYKRIIWSTQSQTPDDMQHDAQLRAFVDEIKVLGRLRSSPYVIKLIGIAWEQDTHTQLCPVLALEYAQLNSLPRFLADDSENTITFREKKQLIANVTAGLDHLHEAGFVWGDCKSDNVLICQDPNKPTRFKAKISDFGLSVFCAANSVRFRGFSPPWTSREARDAVGGDALRRSEIYSLGLVIWSILMHGQQFQQENWCSDKSLEIESSGKVSDRQILALTERGDLQNIAITSFSSSHISRIAEVEIQFFTEILSTCLAKEPKFRSSAKSLHHMLNNNSGSLSTFKDEWKDSGLDFDIEWLTESFGPTTNLHPVGSKFVKQLETLANDTPSKTTEFQLAVCYATGFGCEQNLHTAIQRMHTSALLGHNEAHNLRLKLTKCAKNFKNAQIAASSAISPPLIDLWDDFEHDTDRTLSRTKHIPNGKTHGTVATDTGKDSAKGKQKAIAEFPLHAAVIQGNVEDVCSLLNAAGRDVDEKNENNETALLCAMKFGQPEAFRLLIQAGAEPTAVDLHNRNILHGLVTLFDDAFEKMVSILKDTDVFDQPNLVKLAQIVSTNQTVESTLLKAGTPLEHAVELRNSDAVRYLITLGTDPTLSSSGSSALHRAASQHDCEIMALLLKNIPTESLMRFDAAGRSPLACALSHINVFDRLLLSEDDLDNIERIIRMISGKGHDLQRLNIVTESGESAVYFALRSGNLKQHMLSSFWNWDWEDESMNMVPSPTGPNQWSAIRRSLYCNEVASFEVMCNGLSRDAFKEMLNDISPDGLGILHELPFLPTENAISIFEIISDLASQHEVRISQHRMQPRNSRPRMTPFQLAVLCGRTELADLLLTTKQANPLSGLEKSRFLACIIEYPLSDPQDLSTWLSLIQDDPIVENMRRFPHPTGMEGPLRYLLEHEEAWWTTARKRVAKKEYRIDGPNFDNDADHDPFLSWTPNYVTAVQAVLERTEHPAVSRLGAGGATDNNTFGWNHRIRHVLDHGSFLLRYDPSAQAYDTKGHPYLTALEVSLSVALNSEYKSHAENLFFILLEHFQGPRYCNFPYYQYLPIGRLFVQHLRRRETILHEAIRRKKVDFVRRLIFAGADLQMANIQWQTPLHLARLIDQNKDPDALSNHGSYLGRVGLGVSPAIQTEAGPDDAPSKQIRSILEQETLKLSSWAHLWRFRALREVKWPWDEYETDDLGLRFVLFHLSILTVVMGILTLISRLLSFFPFVAYSLGTALSAGFDPLIELRDCYIGCIQNGSNPHDLCVAKRWDIAPVELPLIVPALNHHLQVILDVFDSCYDNSTNVAIGTSGKLNTAEDGDKDNEDDDEPFLPGCGDDDVLEGHGFDESGLELDKAVYRFLTQECKCGCTWFNEPRMRAEKPKKW